MAQRFLNTNCMHLRLLMHHMLKSTSQPLVERNTNFRKAKHAERLPKFYVGYIESIHVAGGQFGKHILPVYFASDCLPKVGRVDAEGRRLCVVFKEAGLQSKTGTVCVARKKKRRGQIAAVSTALGTMTPPRHQHLQPLCIHVHSHIDTHAHTHACIHICTRTHTYTFM